MIIVLLSIVSRSYIFSLELRVKSRRHKKLSVVYEVIGLGFF